MTLPDIKAVVKHWKEGSGSDFQSARLLFKGRKYLQALFFCHLALEKTLKALIVGSTEEHAPFTHNLVYLSGKTTLELSKDRLAFLETMNRYNLEGRYPAYQSNLRKELSRSMVQKHFKETEQFLKWCQSHL